MVRAEVGATELQTLQVPNHTSLPNTVPFSGLGGTLGQPFPRAQLLSPVGRVGTHPNCDFYNNPALSQVCPGLHTPHASQS